MDWNDVRYFLALARLRSIRAAGASLGVSHSTVARRVEALEERLSARLFDRSRDGYALTEAGALMMPAAERIEAEMAALERGVVGQDERLVGEVSVTCCDHYVSRIVMGELRSFCAEYPGIEIDFNTDSRSFDLSRREADIALRILAADVDPPEFLIGTKLAPVTVANYIAVEHADAFDPVTKKGPARWLAFEQRSIVEGMIAASSYPELPPWGCFNSLELMVQATLEGIGVVMLPTYVGDSEPGLQRLPQADLRHVAELWMLSHPDLRDNARLRATRARIGQAITAHRPLFEGGRPAGAPS